MASMILDLRSPCQPQATTTPWPLPNYSTWWQKCMVWTTCPESLH